MKIFLDDARIPPPADETGPWVWCKDIPDVLALIYAGKQIDVISFDHDLGEPRSANPDLQRPTPTGYQLLRFIEERIGAGVWPFDETCEKVPHLQIHSANPVGRENMERAIRSIDRLIGRDSGNVMMSYQVGVEHTNFLMVHDILGAEPVEDVEGDLLED